MILNNRLLYKILYSQSHIHMDISENHEFTKIIHPYLNALYFDKIARNFALNELMSRGTQWESGMLQYKGQLLIISTQYIATATTYMLTPNKQGDQDTKSIQSQNSWTRLLSSDNRLQFHQQIHQK